MGLFDNASSLGNGSNLNTPSANIINYSGPLASPAAAPNSVPFGPTQTGGNIDGASYPNVQVAGGPTIGVNNATVPAGVGGGTGSITTAQNNAIQGIEDSYNANIADLNNQTNTTNQQYALSKEDLGNQFNAATQNINDTAAAQASQYDQASQTANTASTSAINDARNTYNELQQKNNSYLSSQGLSNSSAADALQESLSRQTFSALNNISTNRDQTLSNIAVQKAQTGKFYNDQVTQLQTGLATAQKQIDNQLNAALDSITNARNLASNQRAAAKNQVMQQAQAAYQSVSAQAANYQNALDSWNSTKNQILTLAGQHTTGDVGVNQLLQGLSSANQNLAKQGVQINVPAFLNSLANPASAAAGTSYITALPAPTVVQTGKNPTTGAITYGAIDAYGNPINQQPVQ